MDSRGYGRTTGVSATARRLTAGLVLAGVLGVGIGMYGLLDVSVAGWLGLPMLGLGALLAVAGLVVGGQRTSRTRYRPDPWALPEWMVAASGLACAAAMFVVAARWPAGAIPTSPLEVPSVPPLALLAALVAVLPAVLAPPPPDRVSEAAETAQSAKAARG